MIMNIIEFTLSVVDAIVVVNVDMFNAFVVLMDTGFMVVDGIKVVDPTAITVEKFVDVDDIVVVVDDVVVEVLYKYKLEKTTFSILNVPRTKQALT